MATDPDPWCDETTTDEPEVIYVQANVEELDRPDDER